MNFAVSKGHIDVVRLLLQNGASVNLANSNNETSLFPACQSDGRFEILKLLLQTDVKVNARNAYNGTAIYYASTNGYVASTLQLLCFGAYPYTEFEVDKTKLVKPICERLMLLQRGKSMGTPLMSDEEKRFMWNLACFLDQKCPEATFKAYKRIRSFITFRGIFMASGYDIGKDSIWRRGQGRDHPRVQEEQFTDIHWYA